TQRADRLVERRRVDSVVVQRESIRIVPDGAGVETGDEDRVTRRRRGDVPPNVPIASLGQRQVQYAMVNRKLRLPPGCRGRDEDDRQQADLPARRGAAGGLDDDDDAEDEDGRIGGQKKTPRIPDEAFE